MAPASQSVDAIRVTLMAAGQVAATEVGMVAVGVQRCTILLAVVVIVLIEEHVAVAPSGLGPGGAGVAACRAPGRGCSLQGPF